MAGDGDLNPSKVTISPILPRKNGVFEWHDHGHTHGVIP
jgi:hypothetical protein